MTTFSYVPDSPPAPEAPFASGRLLLGKLGGVRRIAGRRHRGVGTIPPDALAKLLVLGLERDQLFLQLGNAEVALPAAGALRQDTRVVTSRRTGHGRDPEKPRPRLPRDEAGTMAAEKDVDSRR